jgi:heme exporter protein B
MSFLGTVLAILSKDLRVELRTREIVLSTGLFSFLTVVLSAFAFDLNTVPGEVSAAGVLWISVAFGGILCLGRTFNRERDFGVWTAVLMTPASRAALYLGKTLGVLVFLLAVELVLLPVIDLLFHSRLLGNLGAMLPVMILGTLGYAAAGTLFGAMTIRTRLKDLLLGVILFPLVAPVLVSSVAATRAVASGQGLVAASDYLGLIAVFDVIFLVGGLWLFDALMED